MWAPLCFSFSFHWVQTWRPIHAFFLSVVKGFALFVIQHTLVLTASCSVCDVCAFLLWWVFCKPFYYDCSFCRAVWCLCVCVHVCMRACTHFKECDVLLNLSVFDFHKILDILASVSKIFPFLRSFLRLVCTLRVWALSFFLVFFPPLVFHCG